MTIENINANNRKNKVLAIAVSAVLGTGVLTFAPGFSNMTEAHAAVQDIESVNEVSLNKYRQDMLTLINNYRKENGLKPVKFSHTVSGISQGESDRITITEDVSHSTNYAKDSRRGSPSYSGEIIGVSFKQDPNKVLSFWKSSPAHNKILLSPNADVVGIGITLTDGKLSNTGKLWGYVSTINFYGYENSSLPKDSATTVEQSFASNKKSVVTETPVVSKPFIDVGTNHPFAVEINWAKNNNVLNGWPDGTFRPNESISREATAAIAYRNAGSPSYKAPSVSKFKDIKPGNPFYKEIHWAKANGILNGWSDGTFRPKENIDRNAIAALLYRMEGSPAYKAPAKSAFKDLKTNDPFYKEIHWMKSKGITTGWPDGTFRPYNDTNRDAMAAFLYRMS